jgi:tetrahydrodipicolinate N-succinyltransferase
MPHPYGIIIHSKTVIGERVTIMQQVTIGGKDLGRNLAPKIGDDVYIGAGAKVLGGIQVGNGAVIGANTVVTKDVPAHATVVGANRILESCLPTENNFIDLEVSSFISHSSLNVDANTPIRTLIERHENVVHEVSAS